MMGKGGKGRSFRACTLGSIIGCAVVVALLASGAVCLMQASRFRAERRREMHEEADRMEFSVRCAMEDADRLLTAVCLAPAVREYLGGEGSDAAMEEALRALDHAFGVGEMKLRPALYVEGLSDRAGRVRGLQDAEKAYQRAAGKGALCLTQREGGGLCAAKRVTDLGGRGLRSRGVATVEIEGGALERLLREAVKDSGGACSLCAEDGTVLFAVPGPAGQEAEAIAAGAEGIAALGSGASRRYVSARALPEYGLYVVLSWPGQADWPADLMRAAGFAAALGAVLAALMGTAVADFLLQPLKQLSAALHKMEAGKAHCPLKMSGYRELDALVEHINAQAGREGELMARSARSEKERREAEFQALQAQIHPHFLYNTLDAVNWLAIAYEAEDISTIVTALSDFFRLSLSGGRNIIPLRDEFEHVKSYLEILKVRLGDAIRYEMDLPPELAGCAVAKLTLQPLVENSVEHGLRPRDGGGTVWIYARREGEDLKLYVEDDGVGCAVEELEASIRRERRASSYGVYNVDARIKTVYGERYGLRYAPRPGGGLVACVTLPVRELAGMEDLNER